MRIAQNIDTNLLNMPLHKSANSVLYMKFLLSKKKCNNEKNGMLPGK